MNYYDPGPLYGLVRDLRAHYPEWCFAIRQCHGGPRLEVYRPETTSGLYAVITEDPVELRRELDAAIGARAVP